jgi:hypothetical protein
LSNSNGSALPTGWSVWQASQTIGVLISAWQCEQREGNEMELCVIFVSPGVSAFPFRIADCGLRNKKRLPADYADGADFLKKLNL